MGEYYLFTDGYRVYGTRDIKQGKYNENKVLDNAKETLLRHLYGNSDIIRIGIDLDIEKLRNDMMDGIKSGKEIRDIRTTIYKTSVGHTFRTEFLLEAAYYTGSNKIYVEDENRVSTGIFWDENHERGAVILPINIVC